MALHKQTSIDVAITVIRVPGGWIYQMDNWIYATDANGNNLSYNAPTSVFVPYSDEFNENKPRRPYPTTPNFK